VPDRGSLAGIFYYLIESLADRNYRWAAGPEETVSLHLWIDSGAAKGIANRPFPN
jgi:hypothetical protein